VVVVKEYAEEIISREPESALEEGGEHHNLICIGCGEVFTGSRMPFQHGVIRKKVICNEHTNLAFICNGPLEQIQVRDGHGQEEHSLWRRIKESEEAKIAKKTMRNRSGVRSD
jgi:hypothetical protein